MALGDRVVIMDHGRVRQVGTPAEVYDDPADTFVATFLGSPAMNLLERDGVVLGFRPEHVRARRGGGGRRALPRAAAT
jgi:multiple sugar transport system ATP-binding protein